MDPRMDPGYWVWNLNYLCRLSSLNLPPLLGDHLSHLVQLPVILLVNDNHQLPNGPTKYKYCHHHDHKHHVNLLLHFHLNDNHHLLPYWHHQLVLSWFHHQPNSHQQNFNQRLSQFVREAGTHRLNTGLCFTSQDRNWIIHISRQPGLISPARAEWRTFPINPIKLSAKGSPPNLPLPCCWIS